MPNLDQAELYLEVAEVFADQPQLWHNTRIHDFSFSVARKLRRMKQYLVDVLEEREKISMLHDRIDAQVEFWIRRLKAAGADSIMITEDWGTQTQLLINLRLRRLEFKARFARLADLVHSLGLKLFMDSCGKMTEIIPDRIK